MFATHMKKLALLTAVILLTVATFGTHVALKAQGQLQIGLITKTETNPFFVKMREGAQAAADKAGVKLLTAAGKNDSDNESQVTAIENMVNAGVKGILLVPANSAGIVPAVKKAPPPGALASASTPPAHPLVPTPAL